MGVQPRRDGSPGNGARLDRQVRHSVVLVGPGRGRPEPLLMGLAKRGSKPHVVDEPARVMVELASKPQAVVVIDDPQTIPKLPQLLAAVRRYYPQVACWGYGSQRSGDVATLTRFEPNVRRSVSPTCSPIPSARSSADGTAVPSGKEADPSQVKPGLGHDQQTNGWGHNDLPSPLLTPEELAMLLGSPDNGSDDVDDGCGRELEIS